MSGSRSLIALVEPGSCFASTLIELVLASDRSCMLDGVFEVQPARGDKSAHTSEFRPLP
jgi:benzoyl-CoA-dihydrodiol lyase